MNDLPEIVEAAAPMEIEGEDATMAMNEEARPSFAPAKDIVRGTSYGILVVL
jgi:hypothetical protein